MTTAVSPHRRVARVAALAMIALAMVVLTNAAVALATQGEEPVGTLSGEALITAGENLYGSQCVMCHGANGRGGELGPSLIGQGAASIDFVIRTGRMPLADAGDRPVHTEQKLTDEERRALVAFVPTLSPEGQRGPEIPEINDLSSASLTVGLELFTSNCAACHGPTAAGIAVGRRDVSSNLNIADPVEIAEAIRVGPGVMPVFGEEVIDADELDAIVAWVVHLREREAPGGLAVGRSGPVSEGVVVWLLGIGGLLSIIYLLGDRSGHEHTDLVDASGNPLDVDLLDRGIAVADARTGPGATPTTEADPT